MAKPKTNPEIKRSSTQIIDIQEDATPKKPEKKRSITELRGLGSHLWKDVDAAEYVRKERDSWDS